MQQFFSKNRIFFGEVRDGGNGGPDIAGNGALPGEHWMSIRFEAYPRAAIGMRQTMRPARSEGKTLCPFIADLVYNLLHGASAAQSNWRNQR